MSLRQRLLGLLLLRPGEGRLVLFLSVVSALGGFGLSIGRASSDAIFFTQYGAQHLPLMFALIALVLVPASLAYAAFVDRLAPHRMFVHLTLAFCVVVVGAWLLMTLVEGKVGIALYFIAYGVISEMLLTHFSIYIGGFFDTQQGKRLLPTIWAVSRLGAILGGVVLGVAGEAISTQDVALLWALSLALPLGLFLWYHRGEPIHCPRKRAQASTPVQMLHEGMMFARQSRLVRISALGMFLLVVLLSVQEYLVGSVFSKYYPDEHSLVAFFGWFSAITNACVLVLQMFLLNRLLRRFGLKVMNLVYPFTTLLSFGVMALRADFLSGSLGRINAVGVLPGVRNPVAAMFFHALPTYMQGRAHALIGGVMLPLGLLASALFLWLLPQDTPLEWVAAGGFAVSLLMFWAKLRKNDAYGDSLLDMMSQSIFSHDGEALEELGGLDREAAFRVAGLMQQTDNLSALHSYADLLEKLAPEHAGDAMLNVYLRLPLRLQDQLLPRIARLAPAGWEQVAWTAMHAGDPHLAETTMRVLLAAGFPAALEQVETWLESDSPRPRAAVAVGCLHVETGDCRARARTCLQNLLSSPQPEERLAALGALAAMPHPDAGALVRPLLADENDAARAYALDIWSHCQGCTPEEVRQTIAQAQSSTSWRVRAAAIRAAARLAGSTRPELDWLAQALRDPDYRVREAALSHPEVFLPTSLGDWQDLLEQRGNDFELLKVMVSHLGSSDFSGKSELLQQACDWHLLHAQDKLLVRDGLSQQPTAASPARNLLMQVLREEAERHLDMILHIKASLDPSPRMHYIRAGLSSRDHHLWAQALETAMQSKQEASLYRELARFYEAIRHGVALKGAPPGGKGAPEEWLAWCQREGSAWLGECARYCLDREGVSP
jgi:ATP/ADP translocase/HEAT repeat protein